MKWIRRNRAALLTIAIWFALASATSAGTTKAVAIVLSSFLLAAMIVSFVMLSLSMLRDIDDRHNATVMMLIVFYIVMIIMMFANLYRWVGLIYPASFEHEGHPFWSAVYFSAVTWTTLGYGDVLPGVNARGIAVAEALTGYVAMALLIALISVMIQRR